MSQRALGRTFPRVDTSEPALSLFHRKSARPKPSCARCGGLGRPYAGQAALKAEQPASTPHEAYHGKARQKQADREFFADLLTSAATKRDAKAYLNRLKSTTGPRAASLSRDDPASSHRAAPSTSLDTQAIFGRSRAVEASPVFYQGDHMRSSRGRELDTMHAALIKLSGVDLISDADLQAIAQTFTQLARLSMEPIIVLDQGTTQDDIRDGKRSAIKQADRLITAIDSIGKSGARRVDEIFNLSQDGQVSVPMLKLALKPLQSGRIPVIVACAYSESSQRTVPISADAAILALTSALAHMNKNITPIMSEHFAALSLDRVIVIDPSGPIPSTKGAEASHVFVNMEQEYHSLQEVLRSSSEQKVSKRHATNLTMLRRALSMLPPTASGLITTPQEAANSARVRMSEDVSNVGTRRQKNPLIHNLLTDKPAYSSSLPSGRLGANAQSVSGSTFVKHGMPLTILPNPAAQEWTAEKQPWVKLTDSRIDLERLVYLINDSFDRKLDVEAYLKRVNDRMAGVIIAGDYDGGAVLTWETPPDVNDGDKSRLVPYLDKFAVLKTSQGAGGVADILFNAMARTCFPNGVCWRSRKDNPVNKWYFERSVGTWKIPESNWTMFWTTPGVEQNSQTFFDYEAVCRTVQPTWLDKKAIQD
jgi:amino-acid N-acetyltransferase